MRPWLGRPWTGLLAHRRETGQGGLGNRRGGAQGGGVALMVEEAGGSRIFPWDDVLGIGVLPWLLSAKGERMGM